MEKGFEKHIRDELLQTDIYLTDAFRANHAKETHEFFEAASNYYAKWPEFLRLVTARQNYEGTHRLGDVQSADAHRRRRQGQRISVENTGKKLPDQDREKIFEPFYRGEGKASGTGLGLAIARGMIEAHGGRVWAENLAEGVAFQVSLPLPGQIEPAKVEK